MDVPIREMDASDATPAHASAEPMAAPIDEASLLERLMGSRALVRTVVDTFLEDAPRQLAALTASLASGDLEEAARHAHALKGAAAMLGADAVTRFAEALELAQRQGDLAGARAALPALEGALARATEFLQRSPLRRPRPQPR
jgi:HPt (histidine-containing phosphotransfer) domain-containing protein